MRKILLAIFIIGSISIVNGQVTEITLKDFCPKAEGQEGAICFAYATTYTALSIEYNVKENNTDEKSTNFKSFSYGFVASKVKKNKSFWGRQFNKCGRNATAKLALGVLEKTGTVPFNDFKETCSCKKTDKVLEKAKKYKIKSFNSIGDSKMLDTEHVEKIKQNLAKQKPVVTTIFQESFFYNSNGKVDISFPSEYQKHMTNANHVVCIVGFDDKYNDGSFMVKNNYTKWGDDGFSWVKYEDFIKLIRTSYTIEI